MDGTVRVWDAATGAELHCLRGHKPRRRAWPSTPRAGASSAGRMTGRCGSGTPTPAPSCACLRGHEARVTSVAFDPQGRRIVSGSQDETVRVWDAATGAELHCLRGHKGWVTSVAFDPQGRRIVSGSVTGRCGSGTPPPAPSCTASAGTSIARSQERGLRPPGPAHRQRVVGRDGAGLGRRHRRRAALPPRAQGTVTSVAFDPQGRRIVSGSDDGTVRVWDAATGAELLCLRGHERRGHERGLRPPGPAHRQRVG